MNLWVTAIMNKYLLLVLFILPVSVQAIDVTAVVEDIKSVTSPDNRVVLLELYTSEGCSSCPPADRFLSELKSTGISDKQLIPMAFHVTYWDYIGWKDQFAKKQYDQRQRALAHKKKKSTVSTGNLAAPKRLKSSNSSITNGLLTQGKSLPILN